MSGVLSSLHLALLRAHPREFRETFGRDVEEMLRMRGAEARAIGRASAMRFWLRESWGLLLSVLRERFSSSVLVANASSRANHSSKRAAFMGSMLRESRHALRRLLRAPAFTSASVLTLALAIGANTAIFTLVRRVVLAPLPYERPDQLVLVDHGAHGLGRRAGLGITTGLYALYSERSRTLETIALYQGFDLTVSGDGEAERIRVAAAMPALAEVLRVRPLVGRWFDASEGEIGGPDVAVLSHGFWLRRFGGNTRVIGRTILLGGRPTEVIGIMPPGFAFPDTRPQLWLPYRYGPSVVRAGGFNMVGIARLRDRATLADARAELDRLLAQLPERLPEDPVAVSLTRDARLFTQVTSFKDALIGDVQRTLWLLLGAVAVVLLVACANVANLFLIRAEVRQREVAVRRALGAGRRGITGYFLMESVLLAVFGGALGLLLAFGGVRYLITSGPQTLPRLHEVRIDAAVVAFTAGLSLLAALAFGCIPLFRHGPGLAASLRETGRGNTTSAPRMRARHALMGAQVALALVLLVASALIGRSFQQLSRVHPGFEATSRLRFTVGLNPLDFPDPASVVGFHRQLLNRLEALPGVHGAAATSCPPLDGLCFWDPLSVEGRPSVDGELPPITSMSAVTAGYFELMRIRRIAGRLLEPVDFETGESVAVVDERLAQLYFPGEDPIGKRISPSLGPTENDWFTIVGVVEHVATRSLSDPDPPPQLYVPVRAEAANVRLGDVIIPMAAPRNISFIVHTATRGLQLLPAIRRAVHDLDANVAIARVGTLENTLEQARAPMAFVMTLLAIAGGVGLVLGLIGIYGVITYAVSQRTGEIGVRVALGARPGDVAGMIVREGARVITVGLVVGVAAAFPAMRLMRALLFGVSATDPLTFVTVAASLLLIALLACWLPARRAARLDPIAALRRE